MATTVKKKQAKQIVFRKNGELDDAELIQISRAWHKLFLPHLADFTALDPQMDATFANNWLQLIEDFSAHPSDLATLAELGDLTAQTGKATDAIFVLLEHLEYTVGRAFPKDKRILLEFGFADIRKLRNDNFSRMVLRSVVTKLVAEEYETELLAAGLNANFLFDYDTAFGTMADAEIAQEYFKTVRIKRTTQRIKYFNALYDLHLQVQKAAAIIFRVEPEVAKQFAL